MAELDGSLLGVVFALAKGWPVVDDPPIGAVLSVERPGIVDSGALLMGGDVLFGIAGAPPGLDGLLSGVTFALAKGWPPVDEVPNVDGLLPVERPGRFEGDCVALCAGGGLVELVGAAPLAPVDVDCAC